MNRIENSSKSAFASSHSNAHPKPKIWIWLWLFLIVSSAQAGWLFDDPLELTAKPIIHFLSKDEIQFDLAGKCERFMVSQPEVTVELTYADGKSVVNASQEWWFTGKPITIKLPNNYSDLQSFRITGKFAFVSKWRAHPKNPHPPPYNSMADLDDNVETVHGYKLDSKWNTK